VPEAVIYHRESSSTGGAAHPLQTYYGTRNRLYFMFKHERGLLRRAAFLAFFGLTRLPRLGALHLRRRPDLAAALRHGVEDFARGRMGRAAPERYAPRPRP
jgi:hypothetical protein